MPDRLTILGSGTCQIQDRRMASSVLIEVNENRILFDIGRGICQRLYEVGLKQDDIQHIVLSHFHPDHLSDLIPFLHAACWSQIDPRSIDVNIYGPVGIKGQISKILNLFGSNTLQRETFNINVKEITEESFVVENQRFQFSSLPPANNHGLKFRFKNKTYALSGDSHFHQEELDFLEGVDLAIIDSGHLSDNEIIQLATICQVKIIVCSHLYRELNAKILNQLSKKEGYSGQIIIGEDFMQFDLNK